MIDAPDIQYGDIIGHDRVVRLLKNAVATERVAHAYLFAGSQGVGKTKTAYAFAATLLCKTGGDEACGQCISCKKVVDANHPDLSELKPEEKTNGVIKVKPMREFIRNTHFHPFESDWKIFIIHESEKMNKESANTLLKTLEEPTKNTVIILLTNRPQQLLPTILSRCQKIVFGLLETSTVAKIVSEKRGLSEKDADLVARLAEGSVGRAMHMDLEYSTKDLPNFGQEFFSLRFGRDRKLFEFADAIGAWPSGPLEALEIVMSLLADAVRIAAGIDADRLTYPDLREQAADFAGSYSSRALAAKIRTVIYAQRLIERNANKRLTAEAMLMDILTPRVTRFSERLPR